MLTCFQDIRAEEAEHDWKGQNAQKIKEMRMSISKIDTKLIEINGQISELEWDSDTECEQSGEEDDEKLPALRRKKA